MDYMPEDYMNQPTPMNFPPMYPLRMPLPVALSWLEKYGQALPHPLPKWLHKKSGKVYVRYADHVPRGTIGPVAWVVVAKLNLTEFNTVFPGWIWFEVPTLLVVPFTDAPLF